MNTSSDSAASAAPDRVGPAIRHAVFCLALAAAWLLLSGYFANALLLGLGLASIGLTYIICRRMAVIDPEGLPLELAPRLLAYIPWLLWEVVKANLDVARRVLQRDPRIDPQLFDAPASQASDLGQVIYANSITLTPGTVSVDLEPGRITVHALSAEGRDGILSGEMDMRVRGVEG